MTEKLLNELASAAADCCTYARHDDDCAARIRAALTCSCRYAETEDRVHALVEQIAARPAPATPTREEVARVIDPTAWEEYLLEDGRVDEEVASIFQDAYEESLEKADVILSMLSASPPRPAVEAGVVEAAKPFAEIPVGVSMNDDAPVAHFTLSWSGNTTYVTAGQVRKLRALLKAVGEDAGQ